MTALLGLLNNWRILLGLVLAALVAVVWLYVAHLRAELATATAEVSSAQDALSQAQWVNANDQAALAALKAAAAQQQQAIVDADTLARSRAADLETLRREVSDAVAKAPKPQAGCPAVHPALSVALDGLRRLAAARAAGADPGGAGHAAADAPHLPAGPGGP